jgi:hypothetical protein
MAEEILEGTTLENTSGDAAQKNDIEQPSFHLDGSVVEKSESRDTSLEQSEAKYDKILSRVAPTTATVSVADGDAAIDAKSLSEIADEQSKVQKLIDLAQTKGVEHAVEVARSLEDYYVLDRMHDEMADKLYEGLLEKGLIEKEQI